MSICSLASGNHKYAHCSKPHCLLQVLQTPGCWSFLEVVSPFTFGRIFHSSRASENAALPHGRGSDRILAKSDFTLIDAGGLLHGYSSDVTRVSPLSSSFPYLLTYLLSHRPSHLIRTKYRHQTRKFGMQSSKRRTLQPPLHTRAS